MVCQWGPRVLWQSSLSLTMQLIESSVVSWTDIKAILCSLTYRINPALSTIHEQHHTIKYLSLKLLYLSLRDFLIRSLYKNCNWTCNCLNIFYLSYFCIVWFSVFLCVVIINRAHPNPWQQFSSILSYSSLYPIPRGWAPCLPTGEWRSPAFVFQASFVRVVVSIKPDWLPASRSVCRIYSLVWCSLC